MRRFFSASEASAGKALQSCLVELERAGEIAAAGGALGLRLELGSRGKVHPADSR